MKNKLRNPLLISLLIVLFSFPVYTQGQAFLNNGATVKVRGASVVKVRSGTNPGITNRVGSQLTVEGDVYIDGSLSNAGTLTLGANTIDLKGNYTNTGTVNINTSTIALSGTADQTISTGGGNLYRLTINKASGTALLGANTQVNNRVTMTAGMLNTTASYTLTLATAASLIGEGNTKYVKGKVTQVKAVNNANIGLIGTTGAYSVNVNAVGHGNVGNVTVLRTAGLATSGVSYGINPVEPAKKGIDAIWDITSTIVPSDSVQLFFNWFSDLNNGHSDFTTTRVWKSTNGGTIWGFVGLIQNAGSGPYQMSAWTTSFSKWTSSPESNNLPVELLSFDLTKKDQDAEITWITASEINSDYFFLSRSEDGYEFSEINRTKAGGYSSEKLFYAYTDINAGALKRSTVFYKLSQVDFDGKVTHYPAKAITFEKGLPSEPYVYVNPYDGSLVLYMECQETSEITYQVFNTIGQPLGSNHKMPVVKGAGEYSLIKEKEIAAGVYILRLMVDDIPYQIKFVVK